jgi:hypothetical protein
MMEIVRRFAFRLRFHLAPHRFYNPIDAFSGCLYPQPRIFPARPAGNFQAARFVTQSRSSFIWSMVGLFGHLKIPFRD